MNIHTLQLGELRANCYIAETAPNRCIAIDIGGQPRLFLEFLKMKKLELSKILLTHGHFDHIGGVAEVAESTGAEVYIHSDDAVMLGSESASLASFMSCMQFHPVNKYTEIKDGDEIKDGNYTFRVLHTPGHSMGSVCYISDDAMFSGDTLFCCSIGRTDFTGSDPQLMNTSLEKIYNIKGNYRVFPGHNDKTELEYEKNSNPYFRRFRG